MKIVDSVDQRSDCTCCLLTYNIDKEGLKYSLHLHEGYQNWKEKKVD